MRKILATLFLLISDSAGVAAAYTMLTGTFDSVPRGYDSVLYYGKKARDIWDKIEPENYMAIANQSNMAYNLYAMAIDIIWKAWQEGNGVPPWPSDARIFRTFVA